MRRSWAIAGSLLAASRLALADAAGLTWAGPECADSRAAFESRLAELVAPSERARLSGRVRVERRGGKLGVSLSLALAGAALGERELDVKTCAAAAETAAVAASLAVFSATEPPASPPSAENASLETSATASPPAPASRPPPPRRRAVERRVGLLAAVDAGALPDIAPGAAVELGLGHGRISAALLGGVSLAQSHDIDAVGSVSLRLWSAQGRACYAPLAAESLRLDTCAGVRLFWARGQGRGFPIDRDGSLLALGPAVQLDFSLRGPAPLEWRLELEASAPLSRQRFLVRQREIARFEPVILSGRLGPVLRF
jgi:hypothetical protein